MVSLVTVYYVMRYITHIQGCTGDICVLHASAVNIHYIYRYQGNHANIGVSGMKNMVSLVSVMFVIYNI